MKIFSRSLEDNTPKYPDVCRRLGQLCGPGKYAPISESESSLLVLCLYLCPKSKFVDHDFTSDRSVAPEAESFILDSEIVAWDSEAGKILPFQQLSTRARKGVTEESIKIQV